MALGPELAGQEHEGQKYSGRHSVGEEAVKGFRLQLTAAWATEQVRPTSGWNSPEKQIWISNCQFAWRHASGSLITRCLRTGG
jgi:hypothetical protein